MYNDSQYIKSYFNIMREFKPDEAAVLNMLLSLSDKYSSTKFQATHTWIYETVNLSKSTYFRIIGKLAEQGFISHAGQNIGPRKTIRTTEFEILPATLAIVNRAPEYRRHRKDKVRTSTSASDKGDHEIESPAQRIPEKRKAEVERILQYIRTAPTEAIKQRWMQIAAKENINITLNTNTLCQTVF